MKSSRPMLLTYVIAILWFWMLIDALVRPAPLLWIVAMVIPPLGPIVALAYFFHVKIHDFKNWRLARFFQRLVPNARITELRQCAQQVPSFENLIVLAEALYENRRFEEACGIFEDAFRRDPNNLRASYGLARCYSALQQFERAVEYMAPVVALEPSYRDYDAWLCLAHALWFSGRREEALDSLRKLARTTRAMQHQVALADYLVSADLKDAARSVLEESLLDFENLTPELQLRQQRWLRAARRMLRVLEGTSK